MKLLKTTLALILLVLFTILILSIFGCSNVQYVERYEKIEYWKVVYCDSIWILIKDKKGKMIYFDNDKYENYSPGDTFLYNPDHFKRNLSF